MYPEDAVNATVHMCFYYVVCSPLSNVHHMRTHPRRKVDSPDVWIGEIRSTFLNISDTPKRLQLESNLYGLYLPGSIMVSEYLTYTLFHLLQ